MGRKTTLKCNVIKKNCYYFEVTYENGQKEEFIGNNLSDTLYGHLGILRDGELVAIFKNWVSVKKLGLVPEVEDSQKSK